MDAGRLQMIHKGMLDLDSGSGSPASRQEQQKQQQEGQSDDRHEGSVPGTPPRSPARNGNYATLSCGKEEDAVMSLMKLATPVKSPGLRNTMNGGLGEITPGAGHAWGDGVEMTPVSFFRRSRQSSDFGGHLQSPFQSPLKSFQFSPSCLFSPPGAGTLDFPLSDTPGRGPNRDLWPQTTPDRHGCEDAQGGGGCSGAGAEQVGSGIGGTPGSCGKRKSTALFSDKRGPQDHSRGLGQAWCLGTPSRPSRESGLVHLGVADIPATPDRPTGTDGAQVLPPTPRLLPPTPPPRSSTDAIDAVGGDDAAGILVGLRSPESLSSFSGGSNGDHTLFNSLEDDGHPGTMDRGWSEDWESRRVVEQNREDGGSDNGDGGNKTWECSGVGNAPHTAPVKRHKRWANSAVSLRDAHCKGSFTIERGTLIRSIPSSSSGYGGVLSGGDNGCGGKKGTSKSGKRNVPSRVKNYERSRATEESFSPPKPVLSPDPEHLAISRRSASISPMKTQVLRRKDAISRGPSSARCTRGDRGRRGSTAKVVETDTASAVTPSPAAAGSSKSGRSKPIPREASRVTSARGARVKMDLPSCNSMELNASAPSQRRGKTLAQKKKDEDDDDERNSTTSVLGDVAGATEPGQITCNCKKSKCLKLYCECFQRRQYCSDCNCKECLNTPRTEDLRQVAIQGTIERNPLAFESKFEKRAGKRSHNAGCNCKKSACLKKYCECFQAGVACGSNCKCCNCKNYEGAAGGRKRRAAESLPLRTPPKLAARGRAAATAAAVELATTVVAKDHLAVKGEGRGFVGDEALGISGSATLRVTEAEMSPDHHVQVGGEDEDDEYFVPPSPLVEALRAHPPVQDAPPFYRAASTPDETMDDSGSSSSGSGGGDPLDTPAAGAGTAAAHNNRSDSNRSDISPAASAVEDFAVAKSVLDMGGTPLQVRRSESAHDTKFELSVSAASPGGVHALSTRLHQQQQQQEGVPRGGGGGGVEDKAVESAIGMGSLLSRARREAYEIREKSSAQDNAVIATLDKERAGDGNGGFVANSRGKAGGQACFTPPTPPPTWDMRQGLDGDAAEGADPDSMPRPCGARDDALLLGVAHGSSSDVVTAVDPEVNSPSVALAI